MALSVVQGRRALDPVQAGGGHHNTCATHTSYLDGPTHQPTYHRHHGSGREGEGAAAVHRQGDGAAGARPGAPRGVHGRVGAPAVGAGRLHGRGAGRQAHQVPPGARHPPPQARHRLRAVGHRHGCVAGERAHDLLGPAHVARALCFCRVITRPTQTHTGGTYNTNHPRPTPQAPRRVSGRPLRTSWRSAG